MPRASGTKAPKYSEKYGPQPTITATSAAREIDGRRTRVATASVTAGTRKPAATRVWFATTGAQTAAKAHPAAAASDEAASAPSARRAAKASNMPSQKQARMASRCA